MSLENVLKLFKKIYETTENYLGENQWKQPLFLKFFEALGYSLENKEILFEVDDRNKGKIDILVDNRIVVEVKGSHCSIDNEKAIEQVFQYNSYVGKELVILTNFKEIKIFSIGKNNLLYQGKLINYDENDIFNILRILSKKSFKKEENFNKFFNYYYTYHEYLDFLDEILKNNSYNSSGNGMILICKEDFNLIDKFFEISKSMLNYLYDHCSYIKNLKKIEIELNFLHDFLYSSIFSTRKKIKCTDNILCDKKNIGNFNCKFYELKNQFIRECIFIIENLKKLNEEIKIIIAENIYIFSLNRDNYIND